MRPRAVAGVHQTGRQAPRARRTMKATLSFIATGASTTVGWPAANTRKISSQNPCPTSSTPAKSTVPYRNRSSPVVTRRASDRDSSCTPKPASFTQAFVRSKLSGSGSVHCRNRSASTGTRPTCAMARDYAQQGHRLIGRHGPLATCQFDQRMAGGRSHDLF